MGSCDGYKERVCTKEEKGVPLVKRREVYEFIEEQLRKRYIRLSKLPQTALVFFVKKKDGRKRIVKITESGLSFFLFFLFLFSFSFDLFLFFYF